MKRFFACKYKVYYGHGQNQEAIYLDVGTCFTVEGINANMFELKPVKKVEGLEYPILSILVSPEMLELGFNAQEEL